MGGLLLVLSPFKECTAECVVLQIPAHVHYSQDFHFLLFLGVSYHASMWLPFVTVPKRVCRTWALNATPDTRLHLPLPLLQTPWIVIRYEPGADDENVLSYMTKTFQECGY